MARAKRTPKRDTIIELEDYRTGYRARLKVSAQTLHLAQSGDERDKQVLSARASICIQAKRQMMKTGRSSHWLAWADIAGSITEVAYLSAAVPVRTQPVQGQLFPGS